MATKKKRAAKKAEWGDEDDMVREFEKAEGESGGIKIKEDSGLSSFGEGDAYRITQGRQEWIMVQDTDTAYKLAVAVVKQDLENEPEMFSKVFIESHIDTGKLRRELMGDVEEQAQEDLRNQSTSEFWRTARQYGMDEPEEDEDGDVPDPTEDDIESLAAYIAKDRLDDPMDYLRDIYGDEAAKQAISIAGLNIEAAAEDAVDIDGWEHFLSRYDGNSSETASGFVYWREN